MPAEALKYWADQLEAISFQGLDYAVSDYDIERFEEVRKYSEDLYRAHKKAKEEMGYLTEKQLRFFLSRLQDIAELGRMYSQNRYDERRYAEIQLVHNEMAEFLVEPKPKKKTPKPTKPAKPKPATISFFTEQTIMKELLDMINKSKKKLYIASPWITIQEFTDRLKDAQQRNVMVQVLAREPKSDKEKEQLEKLILHQVNVTPENNLHAKMIITDETELFLGSPNLSGHSFSGNLEVGIRTNDPKVVQEATNYFKDKFNASKRRALYSSSK